MACVGRVGRAIGVVGFLPFALAVARADPAPERTTPEVVVEGTEPAPQPEDPTSFTRVIEVEDYAGEHKRLEDLLESAPGVHVRRFGGPGSPSEISIRGSSSSQVVVLLDGVRLNSAQSGSVDLATIPVELIERIEVSRGGGSVQTGSDAIGGVVNLITKRASARPETRLAGAAASFGTWQGSVSQSGRLGDVEALVGYDVFKTSGDWEFQPLDAGAGDPDPIDRINNRAEHHGGLLKLGRDFGDRLRVELSDQIFHGSEGRPGPALGGGGAQAGQSPFGHQRRTRNVVSLLVTGAGLTPFDIDAELRAFHRFDRSRFRDASFDPPLSSDDRNSSYGGRARLATRWDWGPVEQRPSLGVELRRDELDPKGAGFRERRVLGVFVQQELALFEGRVRLVPALRFDDTEGFDQEWIPKAGLVIAPWPWLELRANAERAYRVPNFDELFFDEGSVRGSPDLRPEDAIDLDAGLRLDLPHPGPLRSLSLEAAAFYNDVDNTIVFQQIVDVLRATNIRDARIRGVEVFGDVGFTEWLSVSGSWTHLDTEVRNTGNPLPGRPEDEYDARLTLAPCASRVKLVGEILHSDEIPVSPSGLRRLSERTTFDASLVLELHRFFGLGERLGLTGLLFSVVATNFTDRAVRDAQLFPRPGRVLAFRVEAWR